MGAGAVLVLLLAGTWALRAWRQSSSARLSGRRCWRRRSACRTLRRRREDEDASAAPLVRFCDQLGWPARYAVEIYDPLPRVLAWRGFSVPLGDAPDALRFLRLPRRPSARPLAARIGVDLNLYRGARLVASSRPRLVREGLIDERLPVGVYRMLYLQGERFAATREKIGSFPYTAGFRVLTDARGQPCYVLSAPTLSEQERIAEEQSRTVASLFGSLLVLIAAGDGDGAGPGRRPHAPAAPPAQRAQSRRQGRVCPPTRATKSASWPRPSTKCATSWPRAAANSPGTALGGPIVFGLWAVLAA